MSDERTGPVAFPPRIKHYGKDEPLPERIPVRAGPLTAVLEGGDLRYVTLGEDPVVLRLYAAIRDRNWNTIEPRFLTYDLNRSDDGFTVHFVAENVGGDVDFEWQGEITGTPDGVITATMDGVARRDFQRNRIGWCVLHPMEAAGVSAATETPDGPVTGEFPDVIAPHQPFFDMESISYETPAGSGLTIRFEGDLWEMEDQRNWTDASFKSYSTPLRIPYPVALKTGDRVRQTVTIVGTGAAAAAKDGDNLVRVTVDPARSRAVPPIGFGVASHGAPLTADDIALLKALRPAHLRVSLELAELGWRQTLDQATTEARALEAALEIEVVTGPDGAGLPELAETLARSGVDVTRVLVFAAGHLDTTEPVMDAAREAFTAAGIDAPIGGGTRGYFTELNRAAETLPLDRMEVVGYTINPQVHAFDNASLTETLAAQPETVRSARAFVGDRELVVGPITLKPPFNPNATGPESPPAAGDLPAVVDARQPSLLGAGWLVGSLNALGNADVNALTYFETTGWRGLIERRDHPLRVSKFHSWPGMVFPVYHVLADVAEFRDGEILPVALSDGLRVQALALRGGDRMRVLLANMSEDPVEVELAAAGATEGRLRQLDDDSFTRAATDPQAFRDVTQPVVFSGGATQFALPAFAVATITADVAPA